MRQPSKHDRQVKPKGLPAAPCGRVSGIMCALTISYQPPEGLTAGNDSSYFLTPFWRRKHYKPTRYDVGRSGLLGGWREKSGRFWGVYEAEKFWYGRGWGARQPVDFSGGVA